MNKTVTILTGEPTIEVIAEMGLDWEGIRGMAKWVKQHRPECLPEGYDPHRDQEERDGEDIRAETCLFPHDLQLEDGERDLGEGCYQTQLSDNELLVELAGRKCYDSFGLKAGKKTNREYIANTQAGDVPHASILYHAKMTFFIAGVSRRVSHELIRNYVGADRDEEGSPSQESTRFTHHYGYYIAPPKVVQMSDDMRRTMGCEHVEMKLFRDAMQENYFQYTEYICREMERTIEPPKGMERKRIYEAASSYLSHACETSFIWTTNPMALRKLFKERCDSAADLEFQRFATKWRRVCVERWPNLFQGVMPKEAT